MSDKLREIQEQIDILTSKKKELKQVQENKRYDGEAMFPIILEYESTPKLTRRNHNLKDDFPPYTILGLGMGEYHEHYLVPVGELNQHVQIRVNLGNVKKPEYTAYKIKLIIEPLEARVNG